MEGCCHFQVWNMMAQCVTPAASSPSLEYVGNVLNVPTMTSARCVTMVISIIWGINSSESIHLGVKGESHSFSSSSCFPSRSGYVDTEIYQIYFIGSGFCWPLSDRLRSRFRFYQICNLPWLWNMHCLKVRENSIISSMHLWCGIINVSIMSSYVYLRNIMANTAMAGVWHVRALLLWSCTHRVQAAPIIIYHLFMIVISVKKNMPNLNPGKYWKCGKQFLEWWSCCAYDCNLYLLHNAVDHLKYTRLPGIVRNRNRM